jgi:predicted DNA-binding ribbon-helix-helix protein
MQFKCENVKRTLFVAGRRTSVSIEVQFWHGLREAAKERGWLLWQLVTRIDAERREPSLSSAIRVFVLDYYRDQVSAHQRQAWSARPFLSRKYSTEHLEMRHGARVILKFMERQ